MAAGEMPGTVIRVSVDRQVVGEITLSHTNKILSTGQAKPKERFYISGPLKRTLGKWAANYVILMVLDRFLKLDQDFGSFVYQPRNQDGKPIGQAKRYYFATAASEEVVNAPRKKAV